MNILIIGNGIAGVTAALRLREKQPDWEIAMVSGESTYHYSRPALMYIFMGHQSYQETKPHPDTMWSEQRIELIRDWVLGIVPEQNFVRLKNGGQRSYDKLLLATGSKSNKFGWPGQDLDGVQGLYDLADLSRLYENVRSTQRAVIVGGGLIGIELAEMLHSARVHVTFLVRESSYWNNVLPDQEAQMVGRLIRKEGMQLELETNLVEILDDGNGRCRAVKTDKGQTIECELVGLTAGVSPRIDLVQESPIETGRGILVDSSLRTNFENIFAAGDCAEIAQPGASRNLLQQVWYTGKYQGELVAEVMAGEERTYVPGIWHNAAKFLDLEYQTYGRVNMGDEDTEDLYWEAADGEHSIRIVHRDDVVTGFNLMGIRFRHDVCERWISEKRSLSYVLDHLDAANFDPEFSRTYTDELKAIARGVNC
ncbi:MAG: NAD(P)H-nitrite reductase large subunit [Candidatus Paceibacteria bacterium]|jgi:NAD(P)H-nitrite reductase large subunit